MKESKLLIVVLFFLFSFFQLSIQTDTTQTSGGDSSVPYCDEIDTHPSTSGVIPTDDSNNVNETNTDQIDFITNGQESAAIINGLLNDLIKNGVEKDKQLFGTTIDSIKRELSNLQSKMRDRQLIIDTLFGETIPSLYSAILSRRARANLLRDEIKTMNKKLSILVDSLDKSSYVQEQQEFMAIIDGLLRIQNSIEMKAFSSFSSVPTTQGPSHPANSHANSHANSNANALLSVAAQIPEMIKAAEKMENIPNKDLPENTKLEDAAAILDQLHALDLLEVESTGQPGLPYQARLRLFTDKIVSILTTLVAKFTALRQKHKEFAKKSRDMWGSEVEILQQQSDDLVSNLESVMDQSQYYLTTYQTYVAQLSVLTAQQHQSLSQYNLLKEEIIQTGVDYNQTTQMRSFQIKKLLEVTHYLLYGNVPYTDAIYVFGCDGVLGGKSQFDSCGVCGGDNSTCMDCLAIPNGKTQLDVCGVCGGEGKSCSYFCDSEPDSGNITDLCGICGGDSLICVGCDQLPNSGVILDECGVCGGDGTSCDIGNEIQLQNSAFVPRPGQSMIIMKCELNTTFTNAWVQNNSLTLRNIFASMANVAETSSQLLYIGGRETVIFAIGVIVEEPYSMTVVKVFESSIKEGSLLRSLREKNIQVAYMTLLDGPTIFRGSDQDPSSVGSPPFMARFSKAN